jgi:dihydrofolate synthase / folylpolyglutamate synthase
MQHDYQDQLDYLYGRLDYERLGMPKVPGELSLRRMRRLLRKLGDPHLGLPIIHVAGTKGKGSTAAMVAAALSASGVRTGLYCSPHLHRLEERFSIDGRTAAPADLAAMVELVRGAVLQLDLDDPNEDHRGATFFEITTAMSLLYFAHRDVGAVVLEVGMGGRLDSTNIVHPALSIITSISFDHVRQLGNTLAAIATEKAGIFKRGRPAVSGVRDPEARRAIRQMAKERRCGLRELDVDFTYESIVPVPPLFRPTPGFVEARTWRTDWGRLSLPLLGAHQAHNAAVALAALDILAEVHPKLALDRNDVIRGFATLRWPARVEVLGEEPWLVIDGAHNAASAVALADTLQTCFPPTPRTLVFGTTREKDLEGQLRALIPLFDVIIATRYVENPRSVAPETIATATMELAGCSAQIASDPAEALDMARRLTPPYGLICVTGSLFLAAEARAIVLPHVRGPSISGVVTLPTRL